MERPHPADLPLRVDRRAVPRTRWTSLLLGSLLLASCAADRSDADTASGGTASARPAQVLLFGDSVARLFGDDLTAAIDWDAELTVDGTDCRRLDRGFDGPCGGVPAGTHVTSGLDGLREAIDGGDRFDAVVVVIANNAALDVDDLDEAMAVLADVPTVWWVTTSVEGRGWRDPNNALLIDLASRDDRARTIDWNTEAGGRDLLADHVHPNEEGQQVLAALVADHLRCGCTP